MQVKEIMTHGVECTRPTATLQEAAKKMRELNVGPLPVCGANDRLEGIITDRDITVRAVAEGKDPRTAKVQDAMTRNISYCFEDQDIAEVARMMKERQIRRLAVLDHNKHLVGIVSLGDLAVGGRNEALSGNALQCVSEPAQPKR
jgi:CBS domain-containing protein